MALKEALSRVPCDDLQRIMWKYGPLRNMYLNPKTPEENAHNERECKDGMRRVREHIVDHYSEVKPDVRED